MPWTRLYLFYINRIIMVVSTYWWREIQYVHMALQTVSKRIWPAPMVHLGTGGCLLKPWPNLSSNLLSIFLLNVVCTLEINVRHIQYLILTIPFIPYSNKDLNDTFLFSGTGSMQHFDRKEIAPSLIAVPFDTTLEMVHVIKPIY